MFIRKTLIYKINPREKISREILSYKTGLFIYSIKHKIKTLQQHGETLSCAVRFIHEPFYSLIVSDPLGSSEDLDSSGSSTDNLPDMSADENESLEDNILYDYEDQSTVKSSHRDNNNFSHNSLSHKYKKSFRSQESLLVSIDHKNFLYNNLSKERELILLANELLSKFSVSYEKRKLTLESARISFGTDVKYRSGKLTSKQENELEERKIGMMLVERIYVVF